MTDTTQDYPWIRSLLDGVMAIEDITVGAMRGRAIRVRGRFLIESEAAYQRLAPKVRERGRTLLLRREDGEVVLLVVEGIVKPKPNNRWLPVVLLVLTVISMVSTYTFMGAMTELSWRGFLAGLPQGIAFACALIVILLSHEFGHFFTARHFGVAVTLPYLIPFPLSPFGTMGAVIRMKDIPPSRRAMLLVGAAGPLAGLVLAIPILILGLSLSTVEPLPLGGGYVMEGNSLLYALLKYIVLGKWLPSGGEDVMLHPVAFAGWAGVLVTSLNLIPAGQLDGGHVAYAVLGRRARYLTWCVIAAVLLLGTVWNSWFLWGALLFFFSRVQIAPLDDVSLLTRRERVIAVVLLILFLVTFAPIPLREVPLVLSAGNL